METTTPDVPTIIEAARTIVFAARRQDALSSLTVKTVRNQVAHDFGLDESAFEDGEIKIAIRNAVKSAVSEELPVAKPPEKRKRTSKGSGSPLRRGPKVPAPETEEQPSERLRGSMKCKKVIESDEDATSSSQKPASTSSRIPDAYASTEGTSMRQASSPVTAKLKNADKSESELSVLLDDPPKPKRAKNAARADHGKKESKSESRKEKDSPKALDKDEQAVKKLKSLVSACGLRKVWSKEFADLPLPKQQIGRLKDILAELGMTGRYSMEQAKAVKEKRELARELNDVVEFERKAGASRSSRNRQKSNSRRKGGELDTDNEVQEGSEDDGPVPSKRKNTASRSIMAYLANQSSDEE